MDKAIYRCLILVLLVGTAFRVSAQDTVPPIDSALSGVSLPEISIDTPEIPELPTIPTADDIPSLPDVPMININVLEVLLQRRIKPEPSIHGIQLEHYLDQSIYRVRGDSSWSVEMGQRVLAPTCVYADTGKTAFRDTLIPGQITYGFHPFWMGEAYQSYYFRLLKRVAYFTYWVDPADGSDRNDANTWDNTGLIREARKFGTEVDLCVGLYGKKDTDKFLKNFKAGKLSGFIAKLVTTVKSRGGSGVNLDFQGMSRSMSDEYTDFIIQLGNALHADTLDLVLTIPGVDWNTVFEIDTLNSVVDLFVMTGYDIYHTENEIAGPPSVLHSGGAWDGYNIENSVNYYLEAGVPNQKLIVSVPWYGKEWSTRTDQIASPRATFCAIRPYRFFKENYMMGQTSFDPTGNVSYYVFPYGKRFKQLWWEDEQSLSGKYDYLIKMKLGGVGIWALGYDNGYTEMWELLRWKYTLNGRRMETPGDACPVVENDSTAGPRDSVIIVDPSITLDRSNLQAVYEVQAVPDPAFDDGTGGLQSDLIVPVILANGNFVSRMRILELVMIALLILLTFGLIGFVISMFDSERREIVFDKRYKFWLGVYCALLIPVIIISNWLPDRVLDVYAVQLIGLSITCFFTIVVVISMQRERLAQRGFQLSAKEVTHILFVRPFKIWLGLYLAIMLPLAIISNFFPEAYGPFAAASLGPIPVMIGATLISVGVVFYALNQRRVIDDGRLLSTRELWHAVFDQPYRFWIVMYLVSLVTVAVIVSPIHTWPLEFILLIWGGLTAVFAVPAVASIISFRRAQEDRVTS